MVEYAIADGDKVEAKHVALLFNSGTKTEPTWVQLSKSTENTISPNPETEERKFITDENPRTLITRYSPELNNPLTLFKGEADYEYFWPKFYGLPTGAGAETEILVVFMNEKDTSGNYDAWKSDATLIMGDLDPNNSQLTFTVKFGGTIERGTVKVTSGTPAFTKAS